MPRSSRGSRPARASHEGESGGLTAPAAAVGSRGKGPRAHVDPPSSSSRTGARGVVTLGAVRLLAIGGDALALADLADRLAETVPEVEIMHLAETDAPTPPALVAVAAPQEAGRRNVPRWLADLAPDLVLWCGEILPGELLSAVADGNMPVIGVDVPAPRGPGWRMRRRVRAALAGFDRVLARNAVAAQALRQLGPPGLRVEVAGPLAAPPEPPPCNATERDDLARSLQARPVWLAAAPAAAELPHVLAAHRHALRGAHRLLLILMPREAEEGAALAAALRADSWLVARRAADETPVESVEIYLADGGAEEAGLWYRLAPVTFLGGTLAPESDAGGDAAAAAALGSAIVAGRAGGSDALLQRLEAAGGLLRVPRPEALGAAVAQLLDPGRAAQIAHAAWDVTSAGAAGQDRVVAAIRASLRATVA